VICEIETDTGHVGVGMTARFLCHAVSAAIRHHLTPALIGMDPRELEAIHSRLSPIVSDRGVMTGVNLAALSCVDLALWDLIGIANGRTVAQMLGGFRDRADVYVTFGFLDYEVDALRAFASDLAAEGHTRFKMLVGGDGDVRADARLARWAWRRRRDRHRRQREVVRQ
jgi:L-rhamnonate dehydratase